MDNYFNVGNYVEMMSKNFRIYKESGSFDAMTFCVDFSSYESATNFDKNYDRIACLCNECQEKYPRIFHLDELEKQYSRCFSCSKPIPKK